MKYLKAFVLSYLYIFSLNICAQEVIFNNKKPLNQNHYNLKRIIQISGESDKFFFRYPRNIKINKSGDIFLTDYNQLLRLNKNGKFIHNYYYRGQGPSELINMTNYLLHNNFIIIFNIRPHKIVWFELDGTLKKEFRLYDKLFYGELLAYHNKKYNIVVFTIPRIKNNSGFRNSTYSFIEFSDKGENFKQLISFPVKTFIVSLEGGSSFNGIARFIYKVYNNRYVVFSHTRKYQIKVFDLKEKTIVNAFSRAYKRIKASSYNLENITIQGKKYNELIMKYKADIKDIVLYKDKIWVVTSTKKNNTTLIDEFDYNGNYINKFYLKLKGNIIGSKGSFLFVREKSEDDNPIIVKYLVSKHK